MTSTTTADKAKIEELYIKVWDLYEQMCQYRGDLDAALENGLLKLGKSRSISMGKYPQMNQIPSKITSNVHMRAEIGDTGSFCLESGPPPANDSHASNEAETLRFRGKAPNSDELQPAPRKKRTVVPANWFTNPLSSENAMLRQCGASFTTALELVAKIASLSMEIEATRRMYGQMTQKNE